VLFIWCWERTEKRIASGRVMIHSSHTSGFLLPHAGARVLVHTKLATSHHRAARNSSNESTNCDRKKARDAGFRVYQEASIVLPPGSKNMVP